MRYHLTNHAIKGVWYGVGAMWLVLMMTLVGIPYLIIMIMKYIFGGGGVDIEDNLYEWCWYWCWCWWSTNIRRFAELCWTIWHMMNCELSLVIAFDISNFKLIYNVFATLLIDLDSAVDIVDLSLPPTLGLWFDSFYESMTTHNMRIFFFIILDFSGILDYWRKTTCVFCSFSVSFWPFTGLTWVRMIS